MKDDSPAGHAVVLPSEDRSAYEAARRRLFEDLRPEGTFENELVQTIADASWRLNRLAAVEIGILALADGTVAGLCRETRALLNLSLCTQRLSSTRDSTLDLLRKLQAERRRGEASARTLAADGFVFSNREISRQRTSGLQLVKKTGGSNPQSSHSPRVS